MGEALAYFLTWTTYGTWLHGDERGWVNRHNAGRGQEYGAPSQGLVNYSKSVMKSGEVWLSEVQRDTVQKAIAEVCQYRGWALRAVNCRTNHVHVVVKANDAVPKSVMTQFKAYATRALGQAGLAPTGKTWTRDGSTRYLNTEASLAAAIAYVRAQ